MKAMAMIWCELDLGCGDCGEARGCNEVVAVLWCCETGLGCGDKDNFGEGMGVVEEMRDVLRQAEVVTDDVT